MQKKVNNSVQFYYELPNVMQNFHLCYRTLRKFDFFFFAFGFFAFFSVIPLLPTHFWCRGLFFVWSHTWTHTHTLGICRRMGPLPRPCATFPMDKPTCPPAGFESATPETERPHTHTLDRAATDIGLLLNGGYSLLRYVLNCYVPERNTVCHMTVNGKGHPMTCLCMHRGETEV